MEFGPDGKLYVGIGDSRNPLTSQDLDTYLGKIIRINADGSAPTGNPFTMGSEPRKRIWGYGFRNPFSLSIHRTTGQVYVNDVGESDWEEINDASIGGRNFGWPDVEGNSTNSQYINPIFTYPHTNATVSGCAITGGAFFDPQTTNYPASYVGGYFYHDYCISNLYFLDLSTSPPTHTHFASGVPTQLVGIKTSPDGTIYFLSRLTNGLHKVVYTTNTAPELTSQPISLSVSQGRSANFSVTTTGSAPLTYQWQKDGVAINGAISASYSLSAVDFDDSGQYNVIVTNAFGNVTSQTALLTVTVRNDLPVAKILQPTNHTIYKAGETIVFSGTATDTEDGTLLPSAYEWTIHFHHGVHFHDGPPFAEGVTSGQYPIPDQGETDSDVFYRLFLTVTDSRGAIGIDSVDIDPKLVAVVFQANRDSLKLTINGASITTPYARTFVSGIRISMSAPASQTLNGITYAFSKWIEGLGNTGTLAISDTDTVFKAIYQRETCASPNGLQPTGITNKAATLTWTATGDTNYEVRWRPIGSAGWTMMSNLSAVNNVGIYSLTGLSPITPYEWQVQAVCSTTSTSTFSTLHTFETFNLCSSIVEGNWDNPVTWSCGRVPTTIDFVQLQHTVEIPINFTAEAKAISYELSGALIWHSGSRLLLGL